MTLYLTRYYLSELSGWVLFTPLGFSIFLLIAAGTDEIFYFTLIIAMYACTVVFSQYFVTRKSYLTLLIIAPLPRKTIIHADFTFLSWIAFCYASYALFVSTLLTLLIQKELLFPTLNEICFLIGCCLLVITLNIWLALQNWVPIYAFNFLVLFMPIVFPWSFVVPFANTYGLQFFSSMLLITSLSYFSMITLVKKGWCTNV